MQAKLRDSGRCVLTGYSIVEVAHIYPYCLLDGARDIGTGTTNVWSMLNNFFTPAQVQKWRESIFPNGNSQMGVETAENMITLSKHAHELWNMGGFALKPIYIQGDKKRLIMQFFWQARHEDLINEPLKFTTLPRSTRGLISYQDDYYLPVTVPPNVPCSLGGFKIH